MDTILKIIKFLLEEKNFLLKHFSRMLRVLYLIVISNYYFVLIFGKHQFAQTFSDVATFFTTGYFLRPLFIFILTSIIFDWALKALNELLAYFISVKKANKMIEQVELIKKQRQSKILALSRLSIRVAVTIANRILKMTSLKVDKQKIVEIIELLKKKDVPEKIEVFILLMWQTFIVLCMIGSFSYIFLIIITLITYFLSNFKGKIIFGIKILTNDEPIITT